MAEELSSLPYDDAGVVVVRAHDDEQIMMGFDMTTGARLWTNNNTVLDIAVGLGLAEVQTVQSS